MTSVAFALQDVLRCPQCRGPLRDVPEAAPPALACTCGLRVPIRDGIPRFVQDDGYVASFSYEWRRHARTQLDSHNADEQSERQFQSRLNRPLEWLRGKLVLDAGCGMGRFAEVAARHGATVVCLDFSYAIDVARANLARFDHVHYIQADLLNPPLAAQTFDLVYSFGVLHHTADTRRAFFAVADLVRPGGMLSMFVYASYNKAVVYSSEFWRRFTTRLPHPVLHWLSAAAIPLYYVYSIPVVGPAAKACLPISMEPHWRWRWLDTFDWYSPRYQSKHTHAEVAAWFAQAGFDHLFVGEGEVTLAGTKQ